MADDEAISSLDNEIATPLLAARNGRRARRVVEKRFRLARHARGFAAIRRAMRRVNS